MPTSSWSTQQLAEFVAAISAAQNEAASGVIAVELVAEALDADVAVIACGGDVVAAVGYPDGMAPAGELGLVTPGATEASLEVPGVGTCAAAAAALDHPPDGTLVVARPDALTREEDSLLRGMARVASMAMRMLRVADDERAAREELERLAREQAALRRLATLVARGVSPGEVLQAVTQEVLSVFGADGTMIVRLESDGEATVVAHVGALVAEAPVGSRWKLEPPLALAHVLRTGNSARVDDYSDARDGFAELVHTIGIQSSVASPIVVEDRLWGAIGIGSETGRFPPDTEQRMVDFIELLATAIANAEAQAALTASRARIVATADETRRRIERDLHDGAQQRLVSLTLQLRAAQAAVPSGLGELAAEIDDVAGGLTAALDELREFARGIHPAILAEGGLALALETLALRSAVPVELTVAPNGRLPEAVEVAAYYVVSEALANAAKHARASRVAVEVEADGGVLHVFVHDDGVGGADLAGGSGLVGLKDRVEALGGRIMLQSDPGAGTTLSVELPLDARATVGTD